MKIHRIFPKKLCITNLNLQNFNSLRCLSSQKLNNSRVVIIGAGISGLIAAKHLYENNFINIKVLEASDHFGGRIKTEVFGDTLVELGAKNIPRPQNAPNFQKYLNIDNLKKFELKQLFIKSDGEVIFPHMQLNIKQTFDNILQNIDEHNISPNILESMNGKEYLESETESKSKILFGQDSQIASTMFHALINDLNSFYGCDMSYVHIDNLKKMFNVYSSLVLEDKNMIDLLKPLANDLTDVIHYNQPVTKINYKTAELTCIDGTIHKADHIICTIPLGHLKTFASHLFEPELPEKKVMAMSEVGFGTPEMIYVRFDDSIKSWFPLRYVYPLLNYDQNSKQEKFYKNITAIYRLPQSEHVLKVNCCKGTECHYNDNDVLDGINKFLTTFCKKSSIDKPSEIIKSNWSTDPKFLGGMPYLKKSNSKRDVDTIACPIFWRVQNDYPEKPVLMFAGDATELVGFGTIEAAVKSGLREANRLIEYHKYALID